MKTISLEKYIELSDFFDVVLPPITRRIAAMSASQKADWGHTMLKLTEAYGKSRGERAILGIFDSGIWPHPDLVANMVKEYSYNTSGETGEPEHSHGTHCAGIAAAADNDRGIIGAAPEAILADRWCLNNDGAGAYGWIAENLRDFADMTLRKEDAHRIKIASLSLGGPTSNRELEAAVKYAISKGVIVVAAAGNDGGEDTIGYPAKYEEVIAVGAIDKDMVPAWFTSGGEEVDVAAPGVDVRSTVIGGGYEDWDGTSMATPYISGLVAVLVGARPDLFKPGVAANQSTMELLLKDVALDIHVKGTDNKTGAGIPVVTEEMFLEEEEPVEEEPVEEEPEEEEPEEDVPTRNKRVVEIPFMKGFEMPFRTSRQRKFRSFWVYRILIGIETNRFTNDIYDELLRELERFFRNSSLVLANNMDYEDAAFWAGRFLEHVMDRKGYEFETINVEGYDGEGRSIYISKEKYDQLRRKARRLERKNRLPVRLLNFKKES